MALLFVDGFDARDLANKWDAAPYPGYTSSTRFNMGSASSSVSLTKLITPSAQVFVGAAFYSTFTLELCGYPSSNKHLVLSASGSTLSLTRSTTVVASYTNYPQMAWNYVEIGATIDDTAGTCIVRLNGQTVIDFTGDTRNSGTDTDVNKVVLGSADADDVYICDSTGSTNNTFLGDVRIQTLFPGGAGSSTQFTPTGSATNYANVNDVPDSTATYNASSTVGQRDTYAMSDLVAGTGTVFGVQENMHAWKSDTGIGSAKLALKSGASVYYGADIPLGTSVARYGNIRETNPATSTAWTVSDVNSLEHGAEVV